MEKKIFLALLLLCVSLAFWACGDDSNSSSGDIANDSEESSGSNGSGVMVKGAWDYMNPALSYGTMTDERDNQIYRTIVIGNQTWMAENLNYADSVATPSLLGRSWCNDDSADSCAKYGRLYTWVAAIDSVTLANDADDPRTCGYDETCTLPDTVQGICPEGWHLPTTAEWDTLFTAVGGSDIAGKVLKTSSGWDNDGNGTDDYGFSALPAGFRRGNGWFYLAGLHARFWSSSEYYRESSYFMDLYDYYDIARNLYYDNKNNAQSVRCLKD